MPAAQVVYGSKSPQALQSGAKALAEVLPDARLDVLEGASHNVKADKLAPLLVGFLTQRAARPLAA